MRNDTPWVITCTHSDNGNKNILCWLYQGFDAPLIVCGRKKLPNVYKKSSLIAKESRITGVRRGSLQEHTSVWGRSIIGWRRVGWLLLRLLNRLKRRDRLAGLCWSGRNHRDGGWQSLGHCAFWWLRNYLGHWNRGPSSSAQWRSDGCSCQLQFTRYKQ